MTERELYNVWHFQHWKKNCANQDSEEFARKMYDRIYSHNSEITERERGFMAWQASANREGFKIVPVEPTDETLELFTCTDAYSAYKAMIGASDENKNT